MVPVQVLEFPELSVKLQVEAAALFAPVRSTLAQLPVREPSQLSIALAEALPEPEQVVDPRPPVVTVASVQSAEPGGVLSTSTTVWEHWLACRLPELSLKPVQLTFELDPDPLRVTEPQFTSFAASQLSERVA